MAAYDAMAEGLPGVPVGEVDVDLELLLPRWRRPSLLQARKADPVRDAAPAPRLTFGEGLVGSISGRERRVIRYRVVRLLDSPDELRGVEIGYLDQGDEVQLIEKYGAYWLVVGARRAAGLAPQDDPRRGVRHGWRAPEGPTASMPTAAESWTMAEADIDSDVLEAYLESRRRNRLTRGLVAQHQDVLVDDVRDEGVRIAVRPQPRPGLVPDEIALGHQPDRGRPGREVRAGEQVAPVLVGVAHDDDRVATLRAARAGAPRTRAPSGRGRSRSRARWPGRRAESVTIA